MANAHATLTSLFTDIANKIRLKKGTTASIKADDFPSEIESIQTGITPSGSQTFTENGTYDVTAIAQAIINVSGGGGLPTWLDFGELNPQANFNLSDEHRLTIEHKLGVAPSYFVMIDAFSTNVADQSNGNTIIALYGNYALGGTTTLYKVFGYNNSSSGASPMRGHDDTASGIEVNATSIVLGGGLSSSSATWSGRWLIANHRYIWFAIADHEFEL